MSPIPMPCPLIRATGLDRLVPCASKGCSSGFSVFGGRHPIPIGSFIERLHRRR
jgi:hypothetical protein